MVHENGESKLIEKTPIIKENNEDDYADVTALVNNQRVPKHHMKFGTQLTKQTPPGPNSESHHIHSGESTKTISK